MAKVDMNKVCLIRCDNCGEINSVALGRIFGFRWWWKQDCMKCEKKIKLKNPITTVCPHCGKMVQKTEDSICLNCGKILYREHEVFTAVCDNCGTENLIPYDHDSVVSCMICGQNFPSEKLRNKPITIDSRPKYILLKDQKKMQDEDLVIWKHPLSEFSAKSRLQVSPGTTALFLQNGVCQEPCGPGDYLLEKTGLTLEEKLDMAAEGEEVILKTEIYCVVDTLPEALWGTTANPVLVRNAEGNKVYRINASGTIVWNVVNAKVFAEKVGFRELHGKEELLKVYQAPGSVDAALVRETRKAASDALRKAAEDMIRLKKIDPMNLSLEKNDLEKEIIEELDRTMTDYGLAVGKLEMNRLEAVVYHESALTLETKRKETIRLAVQKMYSWRTDNIHLLAGNDRKLYADYTFSGQIRLRVDDENRFFGIPEIMTMRDNPVEAERWVHLLIDSYIAACMKPAAQSVITVDRIPIRELDMNLSRIERELILAMNARLLNDGLAVDSVKLDQPQYRESDALRIEAEKEERRKKLIQYAEKPVKWNIDPVDVHMQNDRGLSAQVVFSGTCILKVTDERLFFAQSANQDYLEQDPFVDEITVNKDYARLISGHFYAKLAALTQDNIDNHGWDIRELERYQIDLEQIATSTLTRYLSEWGMKVQKTDLNKPDIIPSLSLQQLEKKEAHGATTEIQEETDKINDKYEMNRAQAEIKKTMDKDDMETQKYIHEQQNTAKRIRSESDPKEAEAEAKAEEIRREALIAAQEHKSTMQQQEYKKEEEVGDIDAEAAKDEAKDKRDAAAALRKKELEQELEQADIDKKNIAEADRRNQERAEAEHKRVVEEIRHQTGLDDARFRETLNGILHGIDQSDLDWRQKLDEYNRMSRKLGLQDAEEARLQAAKTNAEISSLQTEAGYEAGMKKVQLNGAQTELQETINRYAEDRAERMAKANAERAERSAILSFEQQMEDRKQKAEQMITALKEQHAEDTRIREHDERMAEMKAEIEKLKLELDAEKHKVREEAGLGKAQSANEARAREAEAAAEKERTVKQEQREDVLMNRAEALFRYVSGIRQAMDNVDKALQMHLDDNETDVRKEYAQVEKVRAEGLNEQQRQEIMHKLDDLEESFAEAGEGGTNSGKRFSGDQYNEIMDKIHKLMDETDEIRKLIKNQRKKLEGYTRERSCWSCGVPLTRSARFCPNCGTAQVPNARPSFSAATPVPQPGTMIQCPGCNEMIPAGSKVCEKCGKTLFY